MVRMCLSHYCLETHSLKKPMENFSERALEIPADLTDSQMRTAKELAWRTQQLHLEYKLPYVHGKVGIEEAQLKDKPQHQMYVCVCYTQFCFIVSFSQSQFLKASSQLVSLFYLLCLECAGRNTLCMYLLTRSQNVILFFLLSRNDIGLSNSYYFPICKDYVSSEVCLKIRCHELYIHYMPVTYGSKKL